MSVKCPKCHYENPSDSKYCKECGTQLQSVHADTITLRTLVKDSAIGEIVSEKYRLIEELGSGGMGIVYKAEQIKPVKRSVALKIIKLGMDTRQVVARFETERQALAVMDHPNIAKVFDGGSTENGRPYFVMELVRGIPITEYCDKHKLTTRERLELFIQVCQAVQHAHQKGVIHRDLKPSNVLVVVQEDQPVPKIIDFGIAKAVEHRLTERTLFTEQGQLIGTPEYMSPEQAEMFGLDVDTRSDIYSLGIMLYELLVGELPLDAQELRSGGLDKIQWIIRETDPPKASSRLSGLDDTKTSIAEHRKTDPASLCKELKGDLDWIIMKAMEKDRTRRYESANGLTEDIQRYLNNEPIFARPPSTGYRLRKFLRRHKMGFAAAVLVGFALVIGVAGLTIGLKEAVKAKNEALQQAAKVGAINEFLNSMLSSPDPSKDGREVKVIDILDNARERIGESFKDKQEIEASVRHTLGNTYDAIGVYEKSVAELEKALDIQKRILGLDHPDTLNTMNSLSTVFIRMGKYAEAESILRETVSRRKQVLGAEHQHTIISMHNLGIVYYYQGKFKEAESMGRETLEIRKRVLGEDHPDTIFSLENLAIALSGQEKHEEAETVYDEAREKAARIFGPDHPTTLRIMHNLSCELNHLKKYHESESFFLETLEKQKKVFGPDHPDTIITMANLADLLNNMARFHEAEALSREALEKEKKVFGIDHPLTKFTQEVLDKALDGSGRK
jgi:serine/threonine protein kinase